MVKLDQRSLLKRIFGLTSLCKIGESSLFDIKYSYNFHPYSDGIISTCLFGDTADAKFRITYIEPLLHNLSIIQDILPNWYMRVYITPSASNELIQELIDADCEICVMEDISNNFSGTMWRFLPGADSKPFVTHDADMKIDDDNIFVPSLVKSLKKWVQTDVSFLKRHLAHINIFVPISAGMWGAKGDKNNNAPIPDIKQIMEKYCHNWFGCDEAFLAKEIWPKFRSKGYYNVRNSFEYIIFIIGVVLVIILIKKIIHR